MKALVLRQMNSQMTSCEVKGDQMRVSDMDGVKS